MARRERSRPVEESRRPRRDADSRREVGDLAAVAKFVRERPSGESRRPGPRSSASASTRPLRNGRWGSAAAACRFIAIGAGPGSGSLAERVSGAAIAAGFGAGQAWRLVRGRAAPRPVVERCRREDRFGNRNSGSPERGVIGNLRYLPAAPPSPRGIARHRGGKGRPGGGWAATAALCAEPDRNPGGPRA